MKKTIDFISKHFASILGVGLVVTALFSSPLSLSLMLASMGGVLLIGSILLYGNL